jgi:hypothetical protein
VFAGAGTHFPGKDLRGRLPGEDERPGGKLELPAAVGACWLAPEITMQHCRDTRDHILGQAE